ncbi:DUF6088 family protein [Shewanella basaltis]|uniref:DUF6088 family protein n=1 Tax=Shewanella basaltis TaxID=472183 RepID=UPI00200C6BBA|nr:DUF6088 family protein [Shewanella basaltis]MCL1112344.1 DUF6088 family protein [Shewanella basaltis]
MLTVSVSALVANRLSRMKRGVPFSIESFYSLGTTTSVQKAMSRLTKEGQVARLAKGIYSRPKPLASIPSIKIIAKAEEVAKTWARSNKYKITPQGLEVAYRLGLQTQAPVKTVYWTTGPSREFHVGNEVVQVKHTTETKLQWINKPEGALFRGLLSLSPEHTPVSTLLMAIKRLNLQEKEAVRVIRKLSNSPELVIWKSKLNQLENSLQS